MTTLSDQALQQAMAGLKTVGDCLTWAEKQLAEADVYLGHGTDSFHDEAVALLLHVLDKPWDVDPAIVEETMDPPLRDRLMVLIQRRINDRIPAAYLTGRAWFCGLEFIVDERVLIPRSPVAELIAQQFAPWIAEDEVSRVLDLCTGGGCIAIACAHAFEQADIDACDIDAEALAVCQLNIDNYKLNERVHPRQGDGLAAAHGLYDIIVCNPPYVDAQDMQALPEEYRHEPELALASGSDGLDFTRKLLADAADYLTEHGILVVEVGNSMEAVEELWPNVPFVWVEFTYGGHGVFLLTREQLIENRDVFVQAL